MLPNFRTCLKEPVGILDFCSRSGERNEPRQVIEVGFVYVVAAAERGLERLPISDLQGDVGITSSRIAIENPSNTLLKRVELTSRNGVQQGTTSFLKGFLFVYRCWSGSIRRIVGFLAHS